MDVSKQIELQQFRKRLLMVLFSRGWQNVSSDTIKLVHPSKGIIDGDQVLLLEAGQYDEMPALERLADSLEQRAAERHAEATQEKDERLVPLSQRLEERMIEPRPDEWSAPLSFVPLPELSRAVIELAKRVERLSRVLEESPADQVREEVRSEAKHIRAEIFEADEE